MSTDDRDARRLAEWLHELVAACDLDPAGAGERLRVIVGARRARIRLDADVVEVTSRGRHLVVTPPQWSTPVDGVGASTSSTVVDLLDGSVEVSDAFHRGLIEASGSRQMVTRLFHAVEILLDASARVPELRELAADFRQHSAEPPDRANVPPREDESALLARLGVLGGR